MRIGIDKNLLLLVVVSTALRLLFAASVGLGNDEAYHALFAMRLDWSYFDHPPMMALVGRVGLILSGWSLTPFAVRLGFIAMSAGSTLLLARLTSRFFGQRAGFFAALALNATAYYGVAASTFVLPDGPLLFFWILTIDRMAVAVDSPGKVLPWLGVGLAWGGAMLSKYHAIFLPMGMFLYLIAEPSARRRLLEPGPYLAFLVGLLVFSPVLVWNANHEWASFAFQGERAVGGGFRPDALAGAILGQALYLFPWIWIFLLVALARNIRPAIDDTVPGARFLLCQAVFPLAAFLAIASRRAVLPHWSLIGLLPAFVLLGREWSRQEEAGKSLARRVAIVAALPILGGLVFAVEARTGFLQKGENSRFGLIEGSVDPTADMVGWPEVVEEIERRGLLGSPGRFLFTSKWYHSGHLEFALADRYPVLCYNPRGAHHFDYWQPSRNWVGHDGLLVVINETSTEPGMFDRWFERIVPAGEFSILRSGKPIRRVRLFECSRQLRPFPELPGPAERK